MVSPISIDKSTLTVSIIVTATKGGLVAFDRVLRTKTWSGAKTTWYS